MQGNKSCQFNKSVVFRLIPKTVWYCKDESDSESDRTPAHLVAMLLVVVGAAADQLLVVAVLAFRRLGLVRLQG